MPKKGYGADSSHFRSLNWCSNAYGANGAVVDVKDGKVLRTRNMDFTECYTPEELNIWKIEARGKTLEGPTHTMLSPLSIAYKKRAESKNRILHPMLREDWSPEHRNPQNRGKSKFKRISWDEALDILASEIKRQYDLYGPGSILCQADGHGETKNIHSAHGCMANLLEGPMGGATIQARQPDSWEGWYWGAEHVWDQFPTGQGNEENLLLDISENTDLLLCWGCDQETTPWGWGGQWASIMTYWFSDLGIKQIYISPDVNYAVGVHADKWIPVLPNTDLALQFAIAYVWITEGTYDREYIDTHTVGFDWLEYEVMGGEKGEPRTPEWAEGICGVPARVIKALARKWAKEATTIAHCNGGGYIRSAYSHEPGRMEVCLLAMQGLGKPGRNQFKFFEYGLFGADSTRPMPLSESVPATWGGYNGTWFHEYERFIPKTLIPQGITATEPLHWMGIPIVAVKKEKQFEHHQFPAKEGDPYLHMVWSDSPCWCTCWNGGNEFHKALHSENLEFVCTQHPWMENDCLLSDLLLPVSTLYEQTDVGSELDQGTPNSIYIQSQCIEPVGEAKSDWEIVCEVADRLGVGEEYRGTHTDVETCIKLMYEGAGISDRISYEQWREQEIVSVPFKKDWKEAPRGFAEFCEDPVGHPLDTQSGLLEIYSTALAEHFPDDKERMPYPHYIDEGESHSESAFSPRFAKYPFKLVSNHPRWRVHANMDDIPWLRELSKVRGEDGYGYEPVWINPKDAEEYGIEDGDIVKIYNERGWTLGGAVVTERIMPGVISQDHGARFDPMDKEVEESDRGGDNNLIAPLITTSKNCAGEVTNGFLVGIEKVSADDLRDEFPEAMSRDYDYFEGVTIDNWIAE